MGKGDDLKVTQTILPPIHPAENDPGGKVGVRSGGMSSIKPVENEPDGKVGARGISMSPVKPVENEREGKVGMRDMVMSPVKPVENDQAQRLGIRSGIIPPAKPVENEKESEYTIPLVDLKGQQPVKDEPHQKKLIPFSGKLITAEDPLIVGNNYRTLTNMRYGEASPKQVAGMTKIQPGTTLTAIAFGSGAHEPVVGETIHGNTTAATGIVVYTVVSSGAWSGTAAGFIYITTVTGSWNNAAENIHDSTSTLIGVTTAVSSVTSLVESHILAQAFNSGLTTSHVLQNVTAPPGTGQFEATDLWSDEAGADVGYFSDAPDGNVVYCNGVETCIWGGNESRCARFLNFDPASTFMYDYTDAINNTKSDSENVATFATTGNGIDSDAVLMLALDNNVTDSSTSPHTVTNNNVTFTSTAGYFVFGYAAVFNGTTAYLTIPDHSDFDLSGGIWTFDFRGRFNSFAARNPLYYQKTDLTKIPFDSGAHEPVVGETIHGNTTAATGIVDYVEVASGDWGGTAAGFIYVHTVTGAWNNAAENIHDPSHNVIGATTGVSSDAGDNYTLISVDTAGKVNITVYECYGAGSSVVDITCGTALSIDTFYHIEVGESGNTWYIFINGQLKSITSDSSRAKNYVSVVYLGYDGTNFLAGYLDEIRLSNPKLRHSSDFTVPAAAYTTATVVANVYVGSLRPLQGVKFYTATENTATAAAAGYYWSGSVWVALSLTDGTSTAGSTKTLGQTGSITFASTVATAKQKFIEGAPMYYYWFTFTGIDTATSVYYVTLDAPFQELVDYWDGSDRTEAAFYKYTTAYTDYTVNVSEEAYDTSYADTYADLASLGAYSADNNCVIAGFFERVTAVNISVPSDRTNSTAATVCSVDYWSGAAWTTVGTIIDGTAEGGISLAKSGTISWNAPDPWLVFTRTLSNTTLQLYYYRLRWDKALDATTAIYHVSGIPGQKPIKGYKFPIYSQDRLMLCGNKDGSQNSLLISAYETAQVFNGEDSQEISFGNSDALNCGCTLFAMYGSILYNITVLFKDTEMWGLVYSENQWRKYRIAETVGCPAPLTLKTCIIPPLEGQQQNNRSFAIWMGADGVYTSDGRHPIKVSWDIRDLWDPNSTTKINQSYIKSFSAFIDKNRMEYHLFVALSTGTVTTLDAEYVLDMRKWQWFKVDRGSGVRLQCGLSVTDNYGNNHEYGFIETGYMERLEYGTTFDGTNITSTLQTGDVPMIDKDFLTETSVQALILVLASKATTTANVTLTHYTDTASSGTAYTIDPTDATHRLAFPVNIANSVPGLFHSFKMTTTTSDEACGFEPIVLGVFYQPIREHDYV
jgi:hypothetical protein